ncbi:hypothetical protein H5410_004417 [Solanum commersonii]|uniref:Uncharacterized protein n=1 Tax=Solanum commersonii TaxID=4109 RepID=A0A9J6B814_SOLCO|nr:hypothetical protein H5410_004417 [Solanum commersonii]
MEDKDSLNPGNKQVTKEIAADITGVPSPSDITQERIKSLQLFLSDSLIVLQVSSFLSKKCLTLSLRLQSTKKFKTLVPSTSPYSLQMKLIRL